MQKKKVNKNIKLALALRYVLFIYLEAHIVGQIHQNQEASLVARTKIQQIKVKILLLSKLALPHAPFPCASLLPSVQTMNTCGFGMATAVTAITAYFRRNINLKKKLI